MALSLLKTEQDRTKLLQFQLQQEKYKRERKEEELRDLQTKLAATERKYQTLLSKCDAQQKLISKLKER